MTERCILAIDPGVTGALAFYFPSAPERVSVYDMPVAGGEVSGALLAERLMQLRPTEAIIELQWCRETDGKSAAFKSGTNYGAVLGALSALKVPMRRVSPQKWKQAHGLTGKDKEASRALALRLFPANAESFQRKKDHNRAEAALLAVYASRMDQPSSTKESE